MSFSVCSEVAGAVQFGRGVSTFQTVLILESSNQGAFNLEKKTPLPPMMKAAGFFEMSVR
jgi:hypothetical protein